MAAGLSGRGGPPSPNGAHRCREHLAALGRRPRDEEDAQYRRSQAVLDQDTEPNGVVQPVREQAMPVTLMTAEDVDQWLKGSSVEDALTMQKPVSDDALEMGRQ
jgi:hypothetical protein